ncbi:MAG: UDP-4-amino-4-deoxy-L-arabinose--oxoglutarate aminotransferase [Deltaproteobacteria bacterium ADurb.Bin058]|nr:MAG: UDP-4-amino-4-deoxy-L-arabinose--oxoglutarate aminotransferase [Deltaproteobacteria bacterium ADurb.Bin058]
MSEKQFVPLARPAVGSDEIDALARVIQSRHVAAGSESAAFEREVSEYIGGAPTLAVSSGGAALFCALAAMDVGPGDEVVVPAFTFPAAAQAVVLLGATPVAADVDMITMASTPEMTARVCNSKTKAVVVIHPFGVSADIELIADAVGGIPIIEDAACSLGGFTPKGNPSGTVGTLGIYSFHPRKLVTAGEGGVVTGRPEQMNKVRVFRDYGRTGSGPGDIFTEVGLNFRLSDLLASVGRVQLKKLGDAIERHAHLGQLYTRLLADVPSVYVQGGPLAGRVWQSLIVVLEGDAAPIRQRLIDGGIGVGLAAHALTEQTFYKRFGASWAKCPNSERLAKTTLAMPLFSELSESDVEMAVTALSKALGG